MEKPIRIAVIGSCLTRDIFNSQFIEEYKNFFNCILTQNQSSFISLMSEQIPFLYSKINNQKDEKAFNDIVGDLNKKILLLLKEEQPSFIIIDFFADIHFGVVKVNDNQYFTANRWKVVKTLFYKEIEKKSKLNIEKDTNQYMDIWKESMSRFFRFVESELPNTKIILHKSYNTDYSYNNNGEIKQLSSSGKIKKEDVTRLNILWNNLNDYIMKNFEVIVIDMTGRELYSFENHPWGQFYVHFTLDYHKDFFFKLRNLTRIHNYK
jgi:hypothetical protein